LSLKRICLSNDISSIGTGGTNNTIYAVTNPANSYIFIQTQISFPFSAVAEGDLIQFQGYVPNGTTAEILDFTNFINRSSGHYVVATAYTDISNNVQDGRNDAGYCNIIILRSRFQDPSSGKIVRDYFGGGANDNNLETTLDNENDQTGSALLNTSRQTHIVLRVITRDMDSSSNIRPDNV